MNIRIFKSEKWTEVLKVVITETFETFRLPENYNSYHESFYNLCLTVHERRKNAENLDYDREWTIMLLKRISWSYKSVSKRPKKNLSVQSVKTIMRSYY